MTTALLTRANSLQHQIKNLTAQIDIIRAMTKVDTILISNEAVGSVTLSVDTVLPALTFIEDALTQEKESLETKFRGL